MAEPSSIALAAGFLIGLAALGSGISPVTRLVCYTCAHGLEPGPYTNWPAHQAEHRALLDYTAAHLAPSHLALPTEAFARPNGQYSHDKLAWFCTEVRARGMTPVVWVDKWLYVQDGATISAWLSAMWAATRQTNPVVLLSNELDLVWVLGGIDSHAFLGNVAYGRDVLLSLGVARLDVWAGGATHDGMLALDAALGLPVLTWTWWDTVAQAQRADPSLANLDQIVAAELQALQADRATPGLLIAAEIGWSSNLGGDQVQANMLTAGLDGARLAGVRPGLWTLSDWTAASNPDKYGVVAGGQEKPAVQVWRSLA